MQVYCLILYKCNLILYAFERLENQVICGMHVVHYTPY